MSFLNGALAMGALLALAPLIIHLFNRSRFKIIKWGATHLLESVLRKNRRQIQLEQWIILLIRCCIPILLALALARMVVMNWNSFLFFLILPLVSLLCLIFTAFSKQMRAFWGIFSLACLAATLLGAFGLLPDWGKEKKLSAASGEVPASTVILLDDSLSMNTSESFQKAQLFISEFLENMNKQSETSILQLGGSTEPIFDKPTSDPNALEMQIEGLDAQGDRVSLLGGLDQALTIVSQGKNLKREIILLSDFRKTDWQEWDGNAMNAFKKRLEDMQNAPELTWVDFGKESSKNLSVEKLVLSSQRVGIGHPFRIRATLRNFSSEAYEGNLQIRLLGDQNETAIDEAIVSLGPEATTQVAFTHKFESAGPKILHVEIQTSDDLPQDNRKSVAVSVIEKIKVLLIDGDPSQEWLRGETDFIKLALTPFEENQEKGKKNSGSFAEMKDLIDARSIPIASFKDFHELEEASLVVLANLEKLEASQANAIEDFASNGGGVLICAGNRMDLSWYNEIWGPPGSNLLPMPLLKAEGNLLNELAYSKVSNSYFEHPALSMFNDPRNGSISEALIKKWILLDESKVRNNPRVTVLARLTNGHPILAEKKVGKGVIMFWSTSIDTDWTNLPAKPSYLPFAQQIVSYLSDRVLPPRTVHSGIPLTHYLSSDAKDLKYAMEIPNGSVRTLVPRKKKDGYLVEFMNTRLPGTYELSDPERVIAKFAVHPSPSESFLEKATEDQLSSASKSLTKKVNRIDGVKESAWESYLDMDRHRKFGRETWQILLAVVLALIITEVILLRKFARLRP